MRWPVVEVEEIKAAGRNALVGGPFGSDLSTKHYVEDGVPVIRGGNLPDHSTFHDDDFVYVSDEKARDLTSNTAGAGDLIFTQRGTLGQVGLIPQSPRYPRYVISQSQMKLTVEESKAEPLFVYYFFRLPATVETIKNHVSSSGVPHINLGVLRKFKMPLPPLKVQQDIVSLVAAYDDLMENNRRRMALLDDSARQLYREWFVRLRYPGHKHTRICNGVPKGWEIRPLGQCAKFLSGGTPNKARSEFWDGEIAWVSSGEMTLPRIGDASLHITASGAEHGSRIVPPNTILAVVRGMSLAKEFRVAITTKSVAFNQDLKALVAGPDVDPVYLFNALLDRKDQIRDRATEASHGTKKLDTPVLAAVSILLPSLKWQKRFRELVDPLNSQWDNLHLQNQKLRTARDLLLPRLMSGEIAV